MKKKMIFRSKTVFVDLCDTVAKVTEAIEGIYGSAGDSLFYHPKTPKEFWESGNKTAREIFKWAEPFPDAAEALKLLSRRYNIVYLTARPKWAKSVSEDWLKVNGFPEAPIICTQNKRYWVLRHGLFLIDDNPEIVKSIKEVPVYVPARKWNKDFKLRFRWRDMLWKLRFSSRKNKKEEQTNSTLRI